MEESLFTDTDKKQIEALGKSLKEVSHQIETFKRGVPYLKLNRPCTVGDGIQSLSNDEAGKLISLYNKTAKKKRLLKFVPASGAASRMFKTLLSFNKKYDVIERKSILYKAEKKDKDSIQMISFMDGIRDFAFYETLKSVMKKDGLNADGLIEKGQFKDIISSLLTEKGLNYSQMPKGLLIFHKYNDTVRTAFEEHLVEATGYIKDQNGTCSLHFTVSPHYIEKFESLIESIGPRYERNYGVRYKVDFSFQERSTDTLAVDMKNRPFRLNDGSILFRPGGHGALIENLNRAQGNIIFIKNIDNVVPDRLKGHTLEWEKVLGGYLIRTQEKIFSYLEQFQRRSDDEALFNEALDFAKTELGALFPVSKESISAQTKREYLIKKLNRPIRVCAMVQNVGEPGGGPFWVTSRDGGLSVQIVEKAQVDPESEEQQRILDSSTHFNPVDMVCGVHDWQGKPFELKRFVDPEAMLISMKSKEGRDLKAIELPGLWNGAMSDWNTVFIEVPLITFNPVKTINDLLRKEHR
ncbi:MAG: DUF4301 family protein [Thermodesulfobacteriota bacterium]|nr:DUF4301 family protein [Thermodesulfobacteriota bacterium]